MFKYILIFLAVFIIVFIIISCISKKENIKDIPENVNKAIIDKNTHFTQDVFFEEPFRSALDVFLEETGIEREDIEAITRLALADIYPFGWMPHVTDLSPINYFINLERLQLFYFDSFDMLLISDLANLNRLELLFTNEIINPQAIAKLEELKSLYIIGRKESFGFDHTTQSYYDVSLLIPYLINFVGLNLSCVNFSDFSKIAMLENLEYLQLGHVIINDISPIRNLKRLRSLNISSYSKIGSFDPILDLVSLESLYIYQEGYRDQNSDFMLTNIRQLENLRDLTIPGLLNIDINDLLNLHQLSYLEFTESNSFNIADIMPLARHSSLKRLLLPFTSFERYYDFMDGEGKVFEENGIYVSPSFDLR